MARWEEAGSYARVFGYDEEGRLVKIERDYGSGDVQVANEYGYNSDGVRVWTRDYPARQEYRYVCRIGCGGVPMRVYSRAMGSRSWASVEDYIITRNLIVYHNAVGSYMDYGWLPGHWFATWLTMESAKMVYRDAFGVTPVPGELDFPAPLYLQYDEQVVDDFYPLALAKIIIGGLLIVGVAWLSLSCWEHYLKIFGQHLSGDDKYSHCMMGCMGAAACPIPLPPKSGYWWEYWQMLTSGQSPDWLADAIATELGILWGFACRPPIVNPISRFGPGSKVWNCCNTACLYFLIL